MADNDFRVKNGIVVGTDAFISNSITQINSISFNTTQEFNPGVGSLAWDNAQGSISLGLSNTVDLQLGLKNLFYVKNQTGSTIFSNTVVMANGTVGNSGTILISPAIGNGNFPARYIMGVTAENIDNGEDGYVLSFGKLREINTSMFSEGDILYLDPVNPGKMVNTEPVAPSVKAAVAIVVTKHPNAGEIFVRPTFSDKLLDIQDVYISNNISNGQSIAWVSANSRFENMTISAEQSNVYNTYTTLSANDYNSFTTLTANIYNTFAYLNANVGGENTLANLVSDRFTVTTSNIFILSQNVANATNILVSMDGLIQNPYNDYVVSGNTLSLNNSSPIAEGIEVEIRHISSLSSVSSTAESSEVWTIITANQTLSSGNGYFVDVTSSPITVTLPPSPSIGNKIRIVDVAGLSEVNQLTVAGNGEKIQRSSSNLEVSSNSAAFTLIYSNSTYGWILGEV